jgi:hypothetical protein
MRSFITFTLREIKPESLRTCRTHEKEEEYKLLLEKPEEIIGKT